jgi:prepilin-type N-terminal cleavage/methylation domain-containing protein/prepilin-type processing-associated H-X9-DG protein
MKRMTKSGFTLIELLVVIAIIAILAAILFPVFSKARTRALQTACMNNVKQISTAFLSYFQDYDEKFPPYAGVQAWGDHLGWSERLNPYIKSMDVYKCPENSKSNFCYSMNAISSVNFLGQISRVRSPTRFIHLVESCGSGDRSIKPTITGDSDLTTEWSANLPYDNQPDGNVYGDKGGNFRDVPAVDAMPIVKFREKPGRHWGRLYFPGWHNRGNNVMFLDGHVRYYLGWDKGNMTFNDYKN